MSCHHLIRLRLGIDGMPRDRVYEGHPRCASDVTLAGIEDTGGDASLVAYSDKARHIGLYHHVFLGHCLTFDKAIVHHFVGGQSHHTPSGDTLGKREFDRDASVFTARQRGIEECCLRQIFSQLDRLARGICFFYRLFLLFGIIATSFLERHLSQCVETIFTCHISHLSGSHLFHHWRCIISDTSRTHHPAFVEHDTRTPELKQLIIKG